MVKRKYNKEQILVLDFGDWIEEEYTLKPNPFLISYSIDELIDKVRDKRIHYFIVQISSDIFDPVPAKVIMKILELFDVESSPEKVLFRAHTENNYDEPSDRYLEIWIERHSSEILEI